MGRYEDMLTLYLKDKKPEQYKQMVSSGELKEYLDLKTKAALDQKQMLVESGMPDNMAEELVLADLLV